MPIAGTTTTDRIVDRIATAGALHTPRNATQHVQAARTCVRDSPEEKGSLSLHDLMLPSLALILLRVSVGSLYCFLLLPVDYTFLQDIFKQSVSFNETSRQILSSSTVVLT